MNIRDIARIAGVTPGTVSKVLNNYPDISEATRQHVLAVIEEHQYDPKANTKAPKAAPSNRIGLVVEGVYNGLYNIFNQTLSTQIHNAGYTIVSFHDNYYIQGKSEKLAELRTQMEQENVCALIYIGGNFEKVPQEQLDGLPFPTIFLNTALPGHGGNHNYSSIQVSHFETAYAQMRYLAEKGHRDICTLISSHIDNSVYARRVSGYRAALSVDHLEHNFDHFLQADYREDKAYGVLKDYLPRHPEITAVCCAADIMAQSALRAISDCGMVPGKDVELISFDGLTSMAYCTPSVTTFAQPIDDMMQYMDSLLFGLINKERTHQDITFRPIFQKRESC